MWICRTGVDKCNGGSCILLGIEKPKVCPYDSAVVNWEFFYTNRDFVQGEKCKPLNIKQRDV